MKLYTEVNCEKLSPLSRGEKICVLGSCFADAIGEKLAAAGFDVLRNPFGTLYNPASVATAVERLDSARPFTADECVEMGAGAGLVYLGVPEAILNKPTRLDPEEWEVIVSHPSVAVQLLEPLHSFDEIDDWILYHHERIDGKGYYKLKADQIPLASRIIAITDAYSAIRMRRSYKEPKTYEEAVVILKEVSGTQLDPELLDEVSGGDSCGCATLGPCRHNC